MYIYYICIFLNIEKKKIKITSSLVSISFSFSKWRLKDFSMNKHRKWSKSQRAEEKASHGRKRQKKILETSDLVKGRKVPALQLLGEKKPNSED